MSIRKRFFLIVAAVLTLLLVHAGPGLAAFPQDTPDDPAYGAGPVVKGSS